MNTRWVALKLGVPFSISVLIAPPIIAWTLYGSFCAQGPQSLRCFEASGLWSYSALIFGPLGPGDAFGNEPLPFPYALDIWLLGAIAIFVVWQGIAFALKRLRHLN